MSWISHRNNLITIGVISALALLGIGDSYGLSITSKILGTGVTVAQALAVGQIYLIIALWKRYI